MLAAISFKPSTCIGIMEKPLSGLTVKDFNSLGEFFGVWLLSTFLGNILGATLNAFTVKKFRSAEIWTVGCWVRSAKASTVLCPPYPHRHLLLNVRVNIVNFLALKNSKRKWKNHFMSFRWGLGNIWLKFVPSTQEKIKNFKRLLTTRIICSSVWFRERVPIRNY